MARSCSGGGCDQSHRHRIRFDGRCRWNSVVPLPPAPTRPGGGHLGPRRIRRERHSCVDPPSVAAALPMSRSDRGYIAALAAIAGDGTFPPQLTSLIEGLALQKPRRSAAAIHRVARETAQQQGWPEPSYATVHAVVKALDPAMVVLALEGAKAHAQQFDLLHRREADRPNQIWQADHGVGYARAGRRWCTGTPVADGHYR